MQSVAWYDHIYGILNSSGYNVQARLNVQQCSAKNTDQDESVKTTSKFVNKHLPN